MSITLKQLAQKLNLSVSTVSKALNDSHEISEDTKLKVQALAEELQYRPNLMAKSLKTGRSNTIGLVIPYITNPFQSQILEGAQQAALDRHYNLVFMQSREDAKMEEEALNALLQQQVGGIVISPSANSNERFLQAIHGKCPIILVDRIDFDIKTPKIGVNSEKGAFEATQHLIDAGRTEILVVTGKNLGINQKRLLGYKKALMANYLPYKPENVVYVEYGQTAEDLITNLTQLLDKRLKAYSQPIGILCTTDTLTIHTLGILAKLGVQVPDTVSLIGFANTEYADCMNPSLSTVFQPAVEMGYESVSRLIDLMEREGDMEEETVIMDPIIIPRNSTRTSLA